MDVQVGQRFGSWEVIQVGLGKGGQGSIHKVQRVEEAALASAAYGLARALHEARSSSDMTPQTIPAIRAALRTFRVADDLPLGALKILHNPDGKAKERLTREADLYEKLRHPNLLPLLDRDLGGTWLVTAFQERGSLADDATRYLRRPAAALSSIRQLVDALRVLHEKDFTHRDVKPGNVFIGGDGALLLGDAGLVFHPGNSTLTSTGERVGTSYFMPPEAAGGGLAPTAGWDIYSTAKLLWCLIAGKIVLPEPHRSRGYNLEELFPDEPACEAVNVLLDDCLGSRPEDRPISDASSLLARIDKILAAPSSPLTTEGGAVPPVTPKGAPAPSRQSGSFTFPDRFSDQRPDKEGDLKVWGTVRNVDTKHFRNVMIQVRVELRRGGGELETLGIGTAAPTPSDLAPDQDGFYSLYVRLKRSLPGPYVLTPTALRAVPADPRPLSSSAIASRSGERDADRARVEIVSDPLVAEILAAALPEGSLNIVSVDQEAQDWVHAGRVTFRFDDPSKTAAYREALGRAERDGLLEKNGTAAYRLTSSGFEIARAAAPKGDPGSPVTQAISSTIKPYSVQPGSEKQRLFAHLAAGHPRTHTASELAVNVGINEKVVASILREFGDHGFVESVDGPEGKAFRLSAAGLPFAQEGRPG